MNSLQTTISRRAFTLMEVMFSVMILGVGLIAAASLFPIAGDMQRSTMDVITGQQMGASATAMAEQIQFFTKPPDTTAWQIDGDVHPVLPLTGTAYAPNTDKNYDYYKLADRTLPSGDVDGDGFLTGTDVQSATMFWEPYYRWDDVALRWQVFLVIFRRTGDAIDAIDTDGEQIHNFMVNIATPLPGDQRIGQLVITEDGLVQTVTDSNMPIAGWVGRNIRSDAALGGTINMEIVQVVGLTGVTR